MKDLSRCQKMNGLKQLNYRTTETMPLQAGWGRNQEWERRPCTHTIYFHLKFPNPVFVFFLCACAYVCLNKCCCVQSQTSTGCRKDKRVKPLKCCFVKKNYIEQHLPGI